jgi:phage baseplate assembly protein W
MDPIPRFLGTGWGFPPEFGRSAYSVRMVSGIEDIKESLHILFSTIPGERVMLPGYGCELNRYLFRELTPGLAAEMRDTVLTAIARWEARIDADCAVTVDPDSPGLLRIEVDFTVRRTNVRGNIVFPYCVADTAPSGEN